MVCSKKLAKIDNGELSNVGAWKYPSFFLGTPNIFRLRFVTGGKDDIMGVNKFKHCALTERRYQLYSRGSMDSI